MAKKDKVYVDGAKLEAIIREHAKVPAGEGIPLDVAVMQKGFIKVFGPKDSRCQVYVANTKKCGRIDVSGFESKLPGVVRYPEDERVGGVTGEVDFTQPEEVTLETFRALLEELKAQPAKERASRAAPKAKGPAAVGFTGVQRAPVPDKEARRAAIQEAAAKKEAAKKEAKAEKRA